MLRFLQLRPADAGEPLTREELASRGGLPLLKSGLTSESRLSHPPQMKRGSISDKRTSSGQRSALRATL
ncbi:MULTISPECIES: hypothetical protein [unclassified Bradyrhizobium]|jgi:hypothetical protein|uniref:hypothetical protein n=1 Tax=unclassified Bradyrhizobium TaxID=2631580 RepID=UPI0033935B9A